MEQFLDEVAALRARLDGDLEAARPDGIDGPEWAALKTIIRRGRAYLTPPTFVKLRAYFYSATPEVPLFGGIDLFIDTRLEDGYLYPDRFEAAEVEALRIRSDAILGT
jgi:hypothetical protein